MLKPRFSQALVMPVHREDSRSVIACAESYLDRALDELGLPVLLITVLNDRNLESAASANALVDWCSARQANEFGLEEPWLLGHRQGHSVLTWQGLSETHLFGEKSGVGLARKIGSDMAQAMVDQGLVASPWVRAVDADTQAPTGYFKSVERLARHSGLATYPFWHDPANEAAVIYEMSLRYYLLGLESARSPWAYQSIGSCQAVHVETYKIVRGYPNLLAGEDFHLAAKVAKTSPIIRLNQRAPLKLSGRKSDRVPFGTGVGVGRFERAINEHRKPKFYNPDLFRVLQGVNQNLATVVEQRSLKALDACKPTAISTSAWSDVLKSSGLSDETLSRCLRSSPNSKQQFKALRNQFDALNTLHFVHALQDCHYEPLDWSESLLKADWLSIKDLDSARQNLFQLEDALTELIQSASN